MTVVVDGDDDELVVLIKENTNQYAQALPEPSFYERKHLAKTFNNREKSASASVLRRNFQQQGKNSALESDNSSLCNLLAWHVIGDFNAIPVNIGHTFVTTF